MRGRSQSEDEDNIYKKQYRPRTREVKDDSSDAKSQILSSNGSITAGRKKPAPPSKTYESENEETPSRKMQTRRRRQVESGSENDEGSVI